LRPSGRARSVGALRNDLVVGTSIIPDDFVAFGQPTASAFVDGRAHVVPKFESHWRPRVLKAWRRQAPDFPVQDGGVYWQLPGPRFETPAEIRVLAVFTDVVGMTIGSECVAMCEQGLPYAAVCIVDNLANGVADSALSYDSFLAAVRASRPHVSAVIDAFCRDLARDDDQPGSLS
jgi:5'-methylthioadenosine phosphorylase